MMFWIILYAIGMLIMKGLYVFLDAKYGTSEKSYEKSMGRAITIVLWPIFAPIVFILWLSSRY